MFYIDDRQAAETKFSDSILSDDDFEIKSKNLLLVLFSSYFEIQDVSILRNLFISTLFFFVVPFAKHAI